jgi:hypothetical protein
MALEMSNCSVAVRWVFVTRVVPQPAATPSTSASAERQASPREPRRRTWD